MKANNDQRNFLAMGGFIGMLISVIAIFLIIPVLAKGYYAHLGLQLCFTLLMLSTLYTLSNQRSTLYISLAFIIPFFVFDLLSILHNSLVHMVIAYSIYCAYLVYALIVLYKKVLKNQIIDTNLIFGAITIYLLAGILWAKLYYIYDVIHPGSFQGIQSLDMYKDGIEHGYQAQFNLLYYSFMTLTTVGFGDIVPVHHLAKSLTIIEGMFGQLFIATVITKMVAVWHR